MIEVTDKKKCSGCHACSNICPKHCIQMRADVEGFLYPVIDRSLCVDCHLCEKICPILNRECESPEVQQEAYAAYCNDDSVREASSSGGIFTMLAERIIGQGGIVFGAAFSDDYRSVRHISVETQEKLCLLRGSKYVQSIIGDSYQEAKKHLDEGRTVLFTGTPCQIGGLYAFLKKNYDNLFTQDLICHGAPSPKVWESYVEMREIKAGSKTKSVSFRNKTTGWKMYSMTFGFSNGDEYSANLREDPYMKGFLADLYLRPSCHSCAFKTKQRQSDLTLADFWGIQNVLPKLDDNQGTSAVWVHSEKGKALFQNIMPKLKAEKIPINQVLLYNNAAVSSKREPSGRKLFWKSFHDQFPIDVVSRISKRTFMQRAGRYLARLKRKIMLK